MTTIVRQLRLSAILSLGLLFSAGCLATSAAPPQGCSIRTIVVTTGMVGDMVRAVAGDDCRVIALMGTGVDPHLYKPTRSDVKRLLEADVVIYSGLMLEGRMTEAFTHLARGGKPVFAVTERLDHSQLRKLEGTNGHWDPHVWMDVSAWRQCVGTVAERLSEFDPSHAKDYQARAEVYAAQLADLDEQVRAAIASIPEPRRVLITAHDAFGYFARRYDIPVQSVQGVSTESEAGVGDVNHLVEFVVARQVPAIFVESSVNSKTIQAVQEGARAHQVDVKIGAELYSDAMGPAGSYEGTYVGMIDANTTRITRALGGRVAASGLFGRLSDPE